MKQNNSNIEDLFRTSFNNFRVDPSEGSLEKNQWEIESETILFA